MLNVLLDLNNFRIMKNDVQNVLIFLITREMKIHPKLVL